MSGPDGGNVGGDVANDGADNDGDVQCDFSDPDDDNDLVDDDIDFDPFESSSCSDTDADGCDAVSYTHLTLPTIYSV